MEFLRRFQIRSIYEEGNSFLFYELVSTDFYGVDRTFYAANVAQKKYLFSQAEGRMIEDLLVDSYQKFGSEGVESTLIDFSVNRPTDNFH
jgi:hypothetical protein